MSDTLFEDYPINLTAVDISPYKAGNTGVDYITTFDSGEPGLHVMISAILHGNEISGAITLDHLLKNDVRPLAGKLSFAFANPEAYLAFDPNNPWASRYIDEDMNRVWSEDVLGSERTSLELERARQMRPIIDQVDMLLDLHSMEHPIPAMMMAGGHAKGQQLSKDIATPKFKKINAETSAEDIESLFKYPIVIKPTSEGSSIGVYIVKNRTDLKNAILNNKEISDDIIAEQYIEGIEYTVAILNKIALPVIKLIPPGQFYDYDAKYNSEDTKYVCPSALDENTETKLKNTSLKSFEVLNCNGWGRVDIILDKNKLSY